MSEKEEEEEKKRKEIKKWYPFLTVHEI